MAAYGPGQPASMSPLTPVAGGGAQAIGALNQALNSNSQAYQGLENQAQQQYQQNAGSVNSNLVNAGLGNTTVAQTMQQAPLQTLNNALLNITGQQQGAAANIYGQQAGIYNQSGDAMANLLSAQNQQNLSQQQLNLQAAKQQPAQVTYNGGFSSPGNLI